MINLKRMGSIILIFMLSSCVTIGYDTYVKEIESTPILYDHLEYYKLEYADSNKDESYWAYRAILEGMLLGIKYDLVIRVLEEKEDNIIIDMENIKESIEMQLSTYISVWSDAIERHVRNEYSCVDFPTALAITIKENDRMDIFNKLNKLIDELKTRLTIYEMSKYPYTYELYAVIAQYVDLVEDPSGSLMSYSATISNLNSEFSKIKARAELEF
ncbi:MAG: hypothetical protein K9N07_10800 [Candidatus Cloacimonetes bacterium]|nr:hypothetical protein [Candidatus Cloacimonadota bacterium]